MIKAPFDTLGDALIALGYGFLAGLLTAEQYTSEYDNFLICCGWLPEEFQLEIDRRWPLDLKMMRMPEC